MQDYVLITKQARRPAALLRSTLYQLITNASTSGSVMEMPRAQMGHLEITLVIGLLASYNIGPAGESPRISCACC
jgi:hypothetical protein